jgi:acid phosphatase (class A)
MEPVDDLVFSKRLRKPKGEITLFSDTAKLIQLPSPSFNSSLATGKDLLVTQGAGMVRTEGLENSIVKHDKDPAFSIKRYMDIFGLEYDTKYIDELIKESSILILEYKNKFNRPRPAQLAPYFSIQLKLLRSKNAKTPSYPSGHSAQARLVAEVFAHQYPEHKTNLLKAAEECGAGRISAGWHYPSDHKVGKYLGKRLFRALKSQKDKNPIKYDKVFEF